MPHWTQLRCSFRVRSTRRGFGRGVAHGTGHLPVSSVGRVIPVRRMPLPLTKPKHCWTPSTPRGAGRTTNSHRGDRAPSPGTSPRPAHGDDQWLAQEAASFQAPEGPSAYSQGRKPLEWRSEPWDEPPKGATESKAAHWVRAASHELRTATGATARRHPVQAPALRTATINGWRREPPVFRPQRGRHSIARGGSPGMATNGHRGDRAPSPGTSPRLRREKG